MTTTSPTPDPPESEFDWTEHNTSAKFVSVVAEVERLLGTPFATERFGSNNEAIARLILGHLAHRFGLAPQADFAAENARLRSQLAEAREQRDQAAAALVRAETERDGARLECATLEQDMDEIEQCLDETEQQNAGLRAERDEAQDRLRTLRHRIDELVSYMGAWTTSTWADKQDYVYDTLTRALAATAPETGGVVTGTARQLAETLDSRPNATQTGEQTEVRADTHTEAQTGYQGPLDLDAIRARWLHPCGPCDAGYPTGCTCPPGDPRTVIAALAAEIDRLRDLLDEAAREIDERDKLLDIADKTEREAP